MKCSRASPHSLPRTPNPDKKGKGSRPRAPKRFGWRAPRPRNPHIFAMHGPWDPLGGKCASLSFILPLSRAGLWTVLSVTAMVSAGCGMLVGYVVWGRVTAFGLQPQLSAKRMRYSVQAKVTTNCRSAQKLIFSRAPAHNFVSSQPVHRTLEDTSAHVHGKERVHQLRLVSAYTAAKCAGICCLDLGESVLPIRRKLPFQPNHRPPTADVGRQHRKRTRKVAIEHERFAKNSTLNFVTETNPVTLVLYGI